MGTSYKKKAVGITLGEVAFLGLVAMVALSLAGCSAKPENSPVIRKKFAELDKMQKTVELSN